MHYSAYTGPALPEVQVLGKWGRHPRGCCRCRERPRGALGHPVLAAFPLGPLRPIRADNKIHPRRAARWGFRRPHTTARRRRVGLGS